jgi:hypothetical protein
MSSLRLTYGEDPRDGCTTAKSQAFEVGQAEPAHGARDVAEGITPAIAVGVGVRGGPDADAIEHDQGRAAQTTSSPR